MSLGALKASFAPVVDEHTRVLVLGSLPGEMSLRAGRYYAHPQNQFWRLMQAVIGTPLPEAYDDRLAVLRSAGVGLWDTVKTARRTGSLDGSIRGHAANPLTALTTALPRLRAIGFNGGKASVIGRAELGEPAGLTLLTLPSSSPAYTLPFEAKAAAWLQLRQFL